MIRDPGGDSRDGPPGPRQGPGAGWTSAGRAWWIRATSAALVRRKLATIVRNLELLEAVEGLSLEEYRRDPFRKKGAERMLQEAVDAAVDANLHLLRSAGDPAPADYYENFIGVGRSDVIPEALAKRLAPAAGLRNRLVHEYDEIDDEKILEAIGAARTDLGDYVAAVEAYLEAAGF